MQSVSPSYLHLDWADRLRNWATFLVLALHVAAPVAQENTNYSSSEWWAGNFWDSLGRPAVPLFVMLSGYLLLRKDYPLSDFLQRRFVRVVIPSVFWMLVYSFYNHVADGQPATWSEALRGLVSGPVHYHLWFVYLILGLYITYPLLVPWVRTATEKDYLYFFVVCLLGTWVYKTLVWFFNLEIGIYFELFTNQVGYFVLGYYLGHKLPKGSPQLIPGIRNWNWSPGALIAVAWVLIVLGTAVVAIGTWWASRAYGNVFHGFFYDYLTPGVTISAVGWFLLARHAWNGPALRSIESELAATSFGIYLIHVLVMDWWSEAGYWQSKCHPMMCIPIVAVLVYSMSFLMVALIRAFAWGRRIA